MKFINFFHLICSLLTNFNFCYEIISKNILIEIDPELNQAKVIETIEYLFNKTSLIKIEKTIPQIMGNVSNITVTSSSNKIDNKQVIDKDETNSKFVKIYIKNPTFVKRINLEFVYFINNILRNDQTTIGLSNKDSAINIQANIEFTIKKLYENLSPENIISNNPEDSTIIVENQSDTNSSFYTYLVPATRKNFIKKKNFTSRNNFKVNFNLQLIKNQTKQINFKLTENLLLISSEKRFELTFIRPQIKINYKDNELIGHYRYNQYVETLVAIFIIGLIAFFSYKMTKFN